MSFFCGKWLLKKAEKQREAERPSKSGDKKTQGLLLNHDKSEPQRCKPSIGLIPPPVSRTAEPGMAMDAPAAKYFFGT